MHSGLWSTPLLEQRLSLKLSGVARGKNDPISTQGHRALGPSKSQPRQQLAGRSVPAPGVFVPGGTRILTIATDHILHQADIFDGALSNTKPLKLAISRSGYRRKWSAKPPKGEILLTRRYSKLKRLRQKFADPSRDKLELPSSRESSCDESLKTTRRENAHRNSTAESTLSSFGPAAAAAQLSRYDDDEEHVRERSRERRADPLGLNVIHEPDSAPTMDIILVHGLGGTSRKTWSRNRDAALFWPQEWLPYEPGFQTTRILSFGYNAHFAAAGRENILNIADFAKELLFGMKFALNERAEELHIGKVCPF